MTQFLQNIDEQLLFLINGFNGQFADFIMYSISNKFIWVPLYLLLFFILCKHNGLKKSCVWLALLILCIALTDQITSSLLKPTVCRLRPSNLDNPISCYIHIVNNYRGGRFGFPSSHAANTMALAVFWLITTHRRRSGMLLVLWSIVIGYSRVYLGVHYPSDVLAGWIIGAVTSVAVFFAYKKCVGMSRRMCGKKTTFKCFLAVVCVFSPMLLHAQEKHSNDTIIDKEKLIKDISTEPQNEQQSPHLNCFDTIKINERPKPYQLSVPNNLDRQIKIGISPNKDFGNISLKSFILPGALIALGTWGNENDWFVGRNKDIRDELQEDKHSSIIIDDYTQFAPFAATYALGAFGIKAKHTFKQRVIVGCIAVGISQLFVQSLKYTVKTERPDHSKRNSFPSGHTTMAFVGAEMLWQEYKDYSPWIAYSGYAVAAGTGFLRMYNNRHWLSDVIAGAGFGMLSTKLAYWLYPKIWPNKSKGICAGVNVLPVSYGKNNIGLSMTLDF